MATQITASLPALAFPKEVDYPTQEDWAAFSAAAELNFGILGGSWSTQMQLWKTEANLMSTELNTNATIAQGLANYKGDWISQGYTLGQTVSVSGIYYICKLNHPNGQNPTVGGSRYWNLAIGNWYGNFGTGTQSFNGFGGSGFKNYIINGKKIINQRALASTDNSYNQDRWYKAGNNWFQGIEGNDNLISGKKYTLSWVGNATASYYVGTATSSTINAQTFISIANGGNFTLSISAGQNLWIKFASDSTGSTFNFVQLEEGNIATPFEQRPVGLELSLCQRYYETGSFKHWTISSGSGQALGSTLKYSALKRVNPTISSFNIDTVNCSGVFINESNLSSLITYTTSSVGGLVTFSYTWTASAEL